MATDNKTSVLVENLLPDFLDTEGPKFQTFVKAYYEWMETSGQMTEQSKNLLNNQDIDLAAEEFLTYFKREILSDFPEDIIADKRLVYKKIKDLYRSKGSEESYRLLFRILFNEELDFYYPGQDILRASDGRWIQETSLRITKPFRGNPDLLAGEITGRKSNATAKVERVQQITVDGIEVYEVFVTNINGIFLDAEEIDNTANNISGTIISSAGALQNVIITDGGSGHQRNDLVTITSSSGTGGRGRVTITANGEISKIAVTNTGSGFVRTDPLNIFNTSRAAVNATAAGLLTAPIEYTGRYNDVKGFISWSNKLQDNRFYQEYSYVLRSNKVLNTYEEIVKSVVHPAGMRLFGDVLINVDINTNNTFALKKESTLFLIQETPGIFIPEVVSANIDQYEESGDDGAVVPRPEIEIELIESAFDVDIPEAGSGFQLEIELIAAQTSALLNADELVNVNLLLLIQDVTLNETANVASLQVGQVWDPLYPSSNTLQYFANGSLWIREGGSYLNLADSGGIIEKVAKGTTVFNAGIIVNPTLSPTSITSTFQGLQDIELETFIDFNSITGTVIGGVASVDFAFDAYSEITDGSAPFTEYVINDFADLRIGPNYTNKPLNEEITVPVVTEVSLDTGISHLRLIDQSITSSLSLSTDHIADMNIGGASLISIETTANVDSALSVNFDFNVGTPAQDLDLANYELTYITTLAETLIGNTQPVTIVTTTFVTQNTVVESV